MEKEKGVEEAIENSNSRFYKAFESLSIEKMEEVWKHCDDTICIHPGWEMFTSWTAISESWLMRNLGDVTTPHVKDSFQHLNN